MSAPTFTQDTAHRLLLEREALLAEGVKAKAKRLSAIEDELKDLMDASGPIIDEVMGAEFFYEHSATGPEWDLNALMKVMAPADIERLVLKVDNKSVQALIDAGRYGKRELERCASRKPRRGQIIETPLRRSL